MNPTGPEGLQMTLPRSSGDRRIPQLIPHRLLHSTQLHHPAVLEEATRRSANIQLRLADRITAFAGSMNFVWIHAILFAVWMAALEKNPWPTLDSGPYRAPDSALARARRDPLERNVDRQTDVPRGSRSCGVDEFVGDPRSDAVRVRVRQPEHDVREAGGDGAVDRIAGDVGSVVGHR